MEASDGRAPYQASLTSGTVLDPHQALGEGSAIGGWTALTGVLMHNTVDKQCLHLGLLGGVEPYHIRITGCTELIALGCTLSLACLSDAELLCTEQETKEKS